MKTLLLILFLFCTYHLPAQIQQITNVSGSSDGISSSAYNKVGLIEDKLIFPGGSRDLYVTDGTPGGTVSLKDENGHLVQRIFTAELLNNQMIISGYNSEARVSRTLFRTDGTQSGTIMLTGVYMRSISCLETIGDKTYMTADAPSNGLWITDGTPEGTEYIADENGDEINFPCGFDEYNGKVYFSGYHPELGQELYCTDGTSMGTRLVKDINPGASHGTGSGRAVFKGLMWFAATHPNYGRELWTSDGTEAGTNLFMDIWSGTSSSNPGILHIDEDYMYLLISHNNYGREIWRTDGTVEGTQLFADIYEGIEGSSPYFLKPFKDGFLTYAKGEFSGFEFRLMDKDGNSSLIKDINAGTDSPFTLNYRQHQNMGFFEANDGINGKELWRTDGTEEGTYMIVDLNEGAGSSNPEVLQFTETGFYFSAETDEKGRELYFMEVPEFSAACDGDDIMVSGDGEAGTISTDEYWATNTLTSNGIIDAGFTITFKAGQSIYLENGFHAKNGSIVDMSISDCENAAIESKHQPSESRTSNKKVTNLVNDATLTLSPNPSRTLTQIHFTLEKEERISISIRNQTGQLIRQFYESSLLSKGTYQLDFYHKNLSAGMFFVELRTEKEFLTKKMIVLK